MFLSASKIQRHAVKVVSKTDPEKEDGVLFATDIRKAKKGEGKVRFVRFRIGTEVAKKSGFKPGMRIDLQFDPKKEIGILTALPEGSTEGWSLLGLKKNAVGETPLQLFFTWHEQHPAIAEPKLCSNVEVSEEGIRFKFPEGTVFNGLPEDPEPPADRRCRVDTSYKGPFRRVTDRLANGGKSSRRAAHAR
jgi:hypothetical protein